jgi:hypothetical protein
MVNTHESQHQSKYTDEAEAVYPPSDFSYHAEDRPQEECGVFGIFAPGIEVARRTFFGIFALQHRGQESAGIAVTDGEN